MAEPIALARTLRRALLAPVACLLAACSDAPTTPSAYVYPADGQLWAAVSAPAGLPQLSTWMPYVPSSGPEAEAGMERIRGLRRDAEQARREGQVVRARDLEEEAIRVAVVSIQTMPEPRVLDRALGALQLWAQRAESQVELARFPELDSAVAAVRTAHGQAKEMLASGDTVSAIHYLSQGAERIREQSPAAVALQVLARAEARLTGRAGDDPQIERAVHLLRSSREALIAGDPVRALRRALYALQIAERRGIRLRDDIGGAP